MTEVSRYTFALLCIFSINSNLLEIVDLFDNCHYRARPDNLFAYIAIDCRIKYGNDILFPNRSSIRQFLGFLNNSFISPVAPLLQNRLYLHKTGCACYSFTPKRNVGEREGRSNKEDAKNFTVCSGLYDRLKRACGVNVSSTKSLFT